MYDRSSFLDAIKNVQTSSRILCAGFQRDLSSLLDSELPEESARKSLVHLESCGTCSAFFQAIRLQALAHRDLAVPGSLARRMRRLRGHDLFEGMTDSEIVRRLATALYELGKAYALAATDGDYLLEIAQEPVALESFQNGEAAQAMHAARESGACRTEVGLPEGGNNDFLAEAGSLLAEALRLKPRFAEARLYRGFVMHASDHPEEAKAEYREVFLRTDRRVNRGHAAVQLGMLYDEAGEHRKALRIYLWVVASGLADRGPEFSFVLHNIAVEHLSLGETEEAAGMFRTIRDQHPELWASSQSWLLESPALLARLQADESCRRLFEEIEPAFFAA